MGFFQKLFGRKEQSNDFERKCRSCGGTISPSTAIKYDGMCASCYDHALRLKQDEWYVLPKGERKKGPFTTEELIEHYKEVDSHSGTQIRLGKTGDWIAWVNAGTVFPKLVETGVLPPASHQMERSRTQRTKQDHRRGGSKDKILSATENFIVMQMHDGGLMVFLRKTFMEDTLRKPEVVNTILSSKSRNQAIVMFASNFSGCEMDKAYSYVSHPNVDSFVKVVDKVDPHILEPCYMVILPAEI